MPTKLWLVVSCAVCVAGGSFIVAPAAGGAERFQSHPPMRTLPVASERPLADGLAYFVDPKSGRDENVGTKEAPWKTIQHGAQQLKPGDTLCLRGGVYFEHATVTVAGTADNKRREPVTSIAASRRIW
jgi:hypothetical protein